ncbi:MAG: hypothetical protein NVS4B7_08520 [Ktedonobacteraceae bacterium]
MVDGDRERAKNGNRTAREKHETESKTQLEKLYTISGCTDSALDTGDSICNYAKADDSGSRSDGRLVNISRE